MEKQTCKNCWCYVSYYTKGYNEFHRLKHGHCNSYRMPKKEDETCERWRDNERKKEARERISLSTLEEVCKCISDIAQILKERYED